MADRRSYTSGNFMFTLDGVKCGFLKKVSGGAMTADVIKEGTGGGYTIHKHIGGPHFEDFELQVGFSMSRALYQWIEASWRQAFLRKNGSIISADNNLNAIQEREFLNALITEHTIPKCDGSSKDPAYLTVKFAPEHVRFKP